MPENSSRFFCNRDCQYFPCHNGVEEDNFNCLFCYCPLNAVINCGGQYTLTRDGKKDCSKCAYPHMAENYDEILGKVKKLLDERTFPQDGVRI